MQVFFPSPPPPPNCKMAYSLYKVRVDKTTDCGNYNILASGGPGEISDAHITGASQCFYEYLARLQEFALHWSIVHEVVARGPDFTRGA